jgi:hypothetical protein
MNLRKVRRARFVTHTGQKRNAYGVLVGKPKKRPRRSSEDNLVLDLTRNKMEDPGLDSSGSGKDTWQTLVNMAMNLRVP